MQDVIYLAAIALIFPVAFVFVAALGRLAVVGKTRGARLARSPGAARTDQKQSRRDNVRAA